MVVIIGILAAIAIPQFSSTKEKAHDAAAKSDLRNMMSAQETYFAEFGEYATDLSTLDASTRFNPSAGVNTSLNRTDVGSYEADAAHRLSSNCFRIQMGRGANQTLELVSGASSGGGNCGG